MDRKDFIKSCGMACLGLGAVAGMLQSCGISKILTGTIEQSDLLVPVAAFETRAGNELHHKRYIIIHNDKLQFPICIYRHNEQHYTALWLQCSHQGAELQVFGDKLQCPAHGSEFNDKGIVTTGPATNNLRSFPVTIIKEHLSISLKAI